MKKEKKISEGELLIKEYLEEREIKFKREVKISNLKGDIKPYRTADFYLTQYKVYIEFFGLWDIEKSRKDYQKKKETSQLQLLDHSIKGVGTSTMV